MSSLKVIEALEKMEPRPHHTQLLPTLGSSIPLTRNLMTFILAEIEQKRRVLLFAETMEHSAWVNDYMLNYAARQTGAINYGSAGASAVQACQAPDTVRAICTTMGEAAIGFNFSSYETLILLGCPPNDAYLQQTIARTRRPHRREDLSYKKWVIAYDGNPNLADAESREHNLLWMKVHLRTLGSRLIPLNLYNEIQD